MLLKSRHQDGHGGGSLTHHEKRSHSSCASSPEAQRTIVAPAGGQPGSRSAWLDDEIDLSVHGFYSATLAAHEQAWVRPRDPWWPAFQLASGRLLVDALAEGREPLDDLNDLYRRSRA